MEFDLLETFPDALLSVEPTDIGRVLRRPTLIHLRGERQTPLFLSALLHGNETSGLRILQRLMGRLKDRPLPRSLALFFGNVRAAARGRRRLADQPDYNRIWKGGPLPEHRLAGQVLAWAGSRGVFACVDLHNNTGSNPFYACVSQTDSASLYLGSLFSRTLVLFDNPDTSLSTAFSSLCPSVTVECEKPGSEDGITRALETICDLIHATELDPGDKITRDVTVYHTVGRMVVLPEATLSFDGAAADIRFPPDLDHLNFSPLPPGTSLGRVAGKSPLRVLDPGDADITDRFLEVRAGKVVLKRAAVPSMLTPDEGIIRTDCLGYLMEEYPV